MSKQKPIEEEKLTELNKYRALVLAAINYLLEDPSAMVKTENFDSNKHFESLKRPQ